VAYGQEHTVEIPTVSITEGEDYATMVNAVLTEIRATLDAKVTPAGIDINADLSLRSGGTRYGVKDVHRVSLYQQPSNLAAATYPAALYASSGGELYFNDAAGNQVALTNGGSIAATPGSITDLVAPASVVWDSGSSDYHFYRAAATYADIAAGNVLLNDEDSNFIRLDAPALAADYTLEFPNALPASASLLVATPSGSTGTLSFSRDITLDTLTLTGTSSVGGKMTFSTEYAHPQRIQHVTALECFVGGATAATGANPHIIATANGQTVTIPIRLTEGDRLEEITIWIQTSANAGTRTLDIAYWNDLVGTWQFPAGAYAQTTTVTSTRFALTLNLTDITIGNPAMGGVGNGFVLAFFTMRLSDEFWGARIKYSRQ
jgi:hypothetical protein